MVDCGWRAAAPGLKPPRLPRAPEMQRAGCSSRCSVQVVHQDMRILHVAQYAHIRTKRDRERKKERERMQKRKGKTEYKKGRGAKKGGAGLKRERSCTSAGRRCKIRCDVQDKVGHQDQV